MDSVCAGCKEVSYHRRRQDDGKFYGVKCCWTPKEVRSEVGFLHQYRSVAGKRMSEVEVRRIRSRRPAPDGTTPTLRRYARKGDQVR